MELNTGKKSNKTYLLFEVSEYKVKTIVWLVKSNHDGFILGKVFWYPAWRQYIFEPTLESAIVWSVGCLDELSSFISQKMAAHKAASAKINSVV